MNLAAMLDRAANNLPEHECLWYQGKGWTYSQVKELAEKAAGLFQSWGLRKGDKVAIMSFNTPSFVYGLWGTVKAGGVLVPVNHKLMSPEVDYILENSGAKIFIFDGALNEVAKKLKSTHVRMLSTDTAVEGFDHFDALLDGAPGFSEVPLESEEMAEILYTSGTTGKPKGCMLTQRGVIMAAITTAMQMRFGEADRLLLAMPIWHSSPLNNYFMGFQYVGGATVLLREYNPLQFLRTVQDQKCTVYFGAPISYILPLKTIPDFDQYDLSSMRVFVTGGGPISTEMMRHLMEKYKTDKFYQVYGMTETGPKGMTLPPADQLRKAGSIGRIGSFGAQIKLMKTEAIQAKPGDVGEIWLKTDCMMTGYYNNSTATEEAFRNGWYKSGDLARMDSDGYLYMVDRMKDMIVTGGENVYSKEVEDVIATHPDVLECAIVGLPHPEWGETVTAFIVPTEGKILEDETILSFLYDKLAKYKIPRLYKFVEALPHTPSGKVIKYKLREMA